MRHVTLLKYYTSRYFIKILYVTLLYQNIIRHVTLQIPISTLSAVSTLLQSTRPITQRPLFPLLTNNRLQTPAPVSAPVFTAQGVFLGRRTIGARVAELRPAADGSSFKIWSTVHICKYIWYLTHPKAELYLICHLLALLGAHHILHFRGIRVNMCEKMCCVRVF